MKELVRFLFLCILSCFLYNCTYDPLDSSPTGAVPVDKPEDLNIILNYKGDTVNFSSRYETKLSYEVTDFKVQEIVVYIDNEEKNRYHSNPLNLNMYSWGYNLKNGIYKLRLDFYVKSGSGSIAEKLNKENFLYSKEWTLIVSDENFYNSLIIDTTGSKVALNWDKFIYPGFESYDIYKSSNSGKFLVHSIKDKDSIAWTDDFYAGLRHGYYVIVKCNSEDIPSNTVYSDWDLPALSLSKVSTFKNNIAWENYKFKDNVFGYYVFHKSNDNNFQLIKHISDKNIQSYQHEHFAFLTSSTYWVFPDTHQEIDDWLKELKGFDNYYPVYSISYGDKFPEFYNYSYNTYENIYFAANQKIYNCNTNTGEIVDSINNPGNFSNNSKYMVKTRLEGVYYLDFYNMESNTLIKTFKVEDICGKNGTITDLKISDNGIIIFRKYQEQEWVMYDLSNEKKLFQIKNENYLTGFHISPNGKYFIEDGGYSENSVLYEYVSGSYKSLWSQNVGEIRFNPLNNEEISFFTRDGSYYKACIYNFKNKNYTLYLNTDTSEPLYIDYYDKRIVAHDREKSELKILDFGGNTLLTLPSARGFGSSVQFILLKNFLYSSAGKKINLKGIL